MKIEDLIKQIKEENRQELLEDEYKFNNGYLGQEEEY